MIGRGIAVIAGLAFGLVALDASAQGRGEDARAMQADDAANPAFLWVRHGEELWRRRASEGAKSCADCHGRAEDGMKGVAAKYPVFDERLGRPLALDQRIDQCRTDRQGLPRLSPESEDQLGLSAYVGLQSRGLTAAVRKDGPAAQAFEDGRRIYETRMGQLNLSCAQCHDGLLGERLGGSVIPPARVNGYPIYRLDWQSLGSFARRLRGCLLGVRAEPYGADSIERAMLELFLAARETGIVIETPAVRP